MSYIFDVETLDKESTSVVLSAALLYVNFNEDFSYEELLTRTKFVKFSAKEQLTAGRTYEKSTVEWWESQDEDIKKISVRPSKNDVSVEEGLRILREHYKEHPNEVVWVRGNLDCLVIDSLANHFKQECFAPWWNYRDVRTAIDLLKDTSSRAYCDIPEFDKNKVKKHDPIHDVCYDALQLKYGI